MSTSGPATIAVSTPNPLHPKSSPPGGWTDPSHNQMYDYVRRTWTYNALLNMTRSAHKKPLFRRYPGISIPYTCYRWVGSMYLFGGVWVSQVSMEWSYSYLLHGHHSYVVNLSRAPVAPWVAHGAWLWGTFIYLGTLVLYHYETF